LNLLDVLELSIKHKTKGDHRKLLLVCHEAAHGADCRCAGFQPDAAQRTRWATAVRGLQLERSHKQLSRAQKSQGDSQLRATTAKLRAEPLLFDFATMARPGALLGAARARSPPPPPPPLLPPTAPIPAVLAAPVGRLRPKSEVGVVQRMHEQLREVRDAEDAYEAEGACSSRTGLYREQLAGAAALERERQAAPEFCSVWTDGEGRCSPPVCKSLPVGCTMLLDAVQVGTLNQKMPSITQAVIERGRAIKAGQESLKRKQLKMTRAELQPIAQQINTALAAAGELSGRMPLKEFNCIASEPLCPGQRRHWDYDPALVGCAPRKPRSGLLGTMHGARLIVYDEELGHDVVVPITRGSILLFDGDVAHAGASYHEPNTRVHFYLDVRGVERKDDHTWFAR
jgi:hypothetical protein